MKLRTWTVLPMLAGALALGACASDEEAGEEGAGIAEETVGEDEFGGVGVEPDDVELPEGDVGAAEILGNGIDDDGDGLIDEEA